MGRTIADGYLELRADTTKLGVDLRTAIGRINVSKAGQQLGRGLGNDMSKGFAASSTGFLKSAAKVTAAATLAAASVASVVPQVAALGAAVAPAAGAVLVLPAAMLAVKAASATFKLATAGVGDAITKGFTGTAKEAEKAMAGLPPAARKFAGAIVSLKPQVDALRQSVAQRFFLPLQDDIKPLINRYLPMLRFRLADIAGPLGGLGEQLAQSASKGVVFGAVSKLLDATATSVVRVRAGIDPLVVGFARLITATVPFLPAMADGLARVATRFGNFVGEAAKTGRIMAAIREAWSVIQDLGAILGNVGSVIASVYRAAGVSGEGLLGNLRALTAQAAAFFRSAQGAGALRDIFSTLGALGQGLRTSLGAILPAIAQSIRSITPAVVGLVPALVQLVVALAPLLPYFTALVAAIVIRLIPAISAFTGWLTRNAGVLKVAVFAIGAMVVAVKLYALYTNVAAVAVKAWAVAQTIASVASKVWAITTTALGIAIRFATGPIGLIIGAIGLLVAAVVIAYKRNETFRNIVNAVWKSVQQAVSFAWNNVIRPALAALVGFVQNTVMPIVRSLWQNVFKPAFAGMGVVVKAAWVVIQIALRSLQIYLNNTIFPVIRFLYNNVIKPIFSAAGTHIRFVWTNIIRPVLSTFGNFITEKVVPAFKRGVELIRSAWEKVRDAARVPVRFVVNSVINPLIGGINAAAKFVGVKDTIPKIGGFATGGRIPGAPSTKDNLLAMGPGGVMGLATGEYVTNARSTQANLPLVSAINRKRGKVSRSDVDPYLDGGGVGDGIGDFFGKVIGGLKGAASIITDPKKALLKVANAGMDRIPGGGGIVDMLKGMGSRLIGGIGSWLSDKVGGGAIGGGGISGGYRGMQRLIDAQFPGLGMISGFRPGARTLSGSKSLHGAGRAVDYPPSRALAAWIRTRFGAKTKELITPFQDLNLLHGRPHRYTGAIWNQHNFAGGNAHVHWGAARGGLIGKRSGIPLFDAGGTLAPGVNTVYNGTGAPERLIRADRSSSTYNITVNVPVGAHPAAAGKSVVDAIKAYEATNGTRWRS